MYEFDSGDPILKYCLTSSRYFASEVCRKSMTSAVIGSKLHVVAISAVSVDVGEPSRHGAVESKVIHACEQEVI
ncbi:hypothetical protein RHSP_08797 [Rhizobium freirei PRF 81]|uniref:Uncharacterized protein n=1 Tax=Rhizobium freirei PRF 81 TaxID=363754 RepID=N6U1N1_9HYPH|nr:hypothetical protein RHSP_08797 [Rhizobium freirei PRF 81]